ncbi:hypothetical protein L207DRAFT_507669 [Hyaloscypha variabilis F]|uniref:2EXR domain-containing protein n=1 Tax=Hyaloscypha variabilis (strain UAMH 11265 / GT02V1 / F) TaxID=1149755 RepID=A0A2J6S7P8_HYAVF|nr:hypothetical protein L207DRAFT_507669 [Hyaloscypha variabilis F]
MCSWLTSLPPEIRFIIWRLSLSPPVVEILASDFCDGFYLQAALPVALHVCRESRQAVETLYPRCFGSFLQPERIRFNFDLDILYLDLSQEEEGLHHFLGILKETELIRLKYVAIDSAYLGGLVDSHLQIPALKRALKAMTNLREMIVVCDATIGENDNYFVRRHRRAQMKFYAGRDAEDNWPPADIEELPNVQEEYRDWKLSNVMKVTAMYGWRVA